jgi:glycosyltransferase involved in cell wall biosynthesis
MKTRPEAPRRALICAPLPPEYDRESGSRRVYHLIELLLEAGWEVAFVCENAPEDSRHIHGLRERGVLAHVGFDGAAADLVTAGSFDLAIFAFWYLADRYAHLVRRLSPTTRILVESVDLHWLRNARRILGGGNGSAEPLDAAFGTELAGEFNAYARADAVLTVSAKEAAMVNDVTADPALAHHVPDCDEIPPSDLSVHERRGMLFIGNFRHPPNLDAVQYLCQEILPLIPERVREEHPLTIVGNGLDRRVREATRGLQHIRLVGWVPSLVPYLHAARVTVVPLRYGAGTKRKLIQALLARTPSVTTPAGVEGLDVTHGHHVLVAGEAESFATWVERALQDVELWERLASRGRRRILSAHGRAAAGKRLMAVVDKVMARPAKGLAESLGNTHESTGEDAVVRGVREAVAAVVPEASAVLVVSKGDPELVRLPRREGRHFPEAENGRYAGYHPRDSRQAVEHLEKLQGQADHLLLPAPSFWWLGYYRGFAEHLDKAHERVWKDESCVIYRLRPQSFQTASGALSATSTHASTSPSPGKGATFGAIPSIRSGRRSPAGGGVRK